jgi:hypothetical protein
MERFAKGIMTAVVYPKSIIDPDESLPKTESSKNTVPVLPVLKLYLEHYIQYLEGLPDEGNLGKDLKPIY